MNEETPTGLLLFKAQSLFFESDSSLRSSHFIECMYKIAIQGLKGSFSSLASEYLFGQAEFNECRDFKTCFQLVEREVCDFAVIPIENSSIGSIAENFENLSQYQLQIRQEVFLKIFFHLVGRSDLKVQEVEEVYSHPAGLGQIQRFLREHPRLKPIEYFDTAGAVEFVAQNPMRNIAAAASRKAAALFGLNVIVPNIHDNPKNYTRFFVLEKEHNHTANPLANKTSIQFELGPEAGTLSRVLSAFAIEGISLSKIESRPIQGTDWEYRFFADVLAGLPELRMQRALGEVESHCRSLRILGSYQQGAYYET